MPSFPGDVRFSLRGTPYQNNSFVFLEDIGDGDDALLCITNQTACCIHLYTGEEGHAMGNWFFPNGTRVPSHTANETSDLQWDLYSTRGEMVVHMHRRRGGEDGIYRCEIPDAMGINQTIYIGVYTRSECHSYMYTLVLFNYGRTAVVLHYKGEIAVCSKACFFLTVSLDKIFTHEVILKLQKVLLH